jgi:hypothetical protein
LSNKIGDGSGDRLNSRRFSSAKDKSRRFKNFRARHNFSRFFALPKAESLAAGFYRQVAIHGHRYQPEKVFFSRRLLYSSGHNENQFSKNF